MIMSEIKKYVEIDNNNYQVKNDENICDENVCYENDTYLEVYESKRKEKELHARRRKIRFGIRKRFLELLDGIKKRGDKRNKNFRGKDISGLNPRESKKFEANRRKSKRGRGMMDMRAEMGRIGFDSVYDFTDTVYSNPDWDTDMYKGYGDLAGIKLLYDYLGEDNTNYDQEKIAEFLSESDTVEKLMMIHRMPLKEAVESIRCKSVYEKTYAYNYILYRLDFYRRLVKGEPIQYYKKEIDDNTGEEKSVTKEIVVPREEIDRHSLSIGLKRDILYAAMIGSPELAVYKIAKKTIPAGPLKGRGKVFIPLPSNFHYADKKEPLGSLIHFPKLFGVFSSIDLGSIGETYPLLAYVYQEALNLVENKTEDSALNKQEIEHKAVKQAASWLIEAFNYYNHDRGPNSPYTPTLKEAIIWARLGDNQVKSELRGMRRKIMGIDLSNIKRFIGRCGQNPYAKRRARIDRKIKCLEYLYTDKRAQQEDIIRTENLRALEKEEYKMRELKERLNKKYGKEVRDVSDQPLSEGERDIELKRLEEELLSQVSLIEKEYQDVCQLISSRGQKEVLNELKLQKKCIDQKYNKRKNLLQKALDLYWMEGVMRYDETDYMNDKLLKNDKNLVFNPIDWINYAPLGTIKRAHKMLQNGYDKKFIIQYALTEIICGEGEITRDKFTQIKKFYDDLETDKHNAKSTLLNLIKVSSILSSCHYDLPLQEKLMMSIQDFEGLKKMLNEYGLEETRKIIDLGGYLPDYPRVKESLDQKGINLTREDISKLSLCSKKIVGLEEALNYFSIEEIKQFIQEGAYLSTMVRLKENQEKFSFSISLPEMIDFASEIGHENCLYTLLLDLPFGQLKYLKENEVDTLYFKRIKEELHKHGYLLGFEDMVGLVNRLDKFRKYADLAWYFDNFSLEDFCYLLDRVKCLIVFKELAELLQEKGVSCEIDQIISISRCLEWVYEDETILDLIDYFGLKTLVEITDNEIDLSKVVSLKYEITRKKMAKIIDPEVIIVILKNNIRVNTFYQLLEAGFTREELVKFPYLISSLIHDLKYV